MVCKHAAETRTNGHKVRQTHTLLYLLPYKSALEEALRVMYWTVT